MLDAPEVNLYVKNCIDKYFESKPSNIKIMHEQEGEESGQFMFFFDWLLNL